MAYDVDTKVLGGLPVTLGYTLEGRDVVDWWIDAIGGKPLKKSNSADWLMRRLSRDDCEELARRCQEHADEARAW